MNTVMPYIPSPLIREGQSLPQRKLGERVIKHRIFLSPHLNPFDKLRTGFSRREKEYQNQID